METKIQFDNNVKMIAYSTDKRKRLIIPSRESFLDDELQMPHWLIDSGCNSLLLTLYGMEGGLQAVLSKYSREKRFIWELSTGGGISSLPTINLGISHDDASFNFKIILATDLGGYPITIKNLRFHLTWEDAKYMYTNISDLDLVSATKLKDFINTGDKLALIGISITSEARKHNLLGQSVLFGRTSIQERKAWMLLDSGFQFTKKNVEEIGKTISFYGEKFFKENPEFQQLEDDDHDGEIYD